MASPMTINQIISKPCFWSTFSFELILFHGMTVRAMNLVNSIIDSPLCMKSSLFLNCCRGNKYNSQYLIFHLIISEHLNLFVYRSDIAASSQTIKWWQRFQRSVVHGFDFRFLFHCSKMFDLYNAEFKKFSIPYRE